MTLAMFPARWQAGKEPPNEDGTPDSLELLLEASNQPCATPRKPENKTPTAKLIEDLNKRLVRHISDHDWDHPDFAEYVSEDYRAHLDYHDVPHIVGRDNYIASYRRFTEEHPAYRIEAISTVADVHENHSNAVVWMVLKVEGHPKDVQRESVTVMYWRRRAGKWQVYKQNGMRGAGAYLEPN